MARPLRPQWRARTSIRRRHRTWVGAMVLATAGWTTWWLALVLHRWQPSAAPSWPWVYGIACTFAAIGMLFALFTIRARTIWILLAGVALVANGSLLLVPLLLHEDVTRALAR